MAQPLINGKAYSWSQVEIRFSNISTPLNGVSKIEYSDEQKTEFNYGAGNFPVSRGFGNVESEAKITLHMEDIEDIRSNIPSGRLQDLGEFDVIVSYLHPVAARVVTHVIKNCYISNNGVEVSQDDMMIEKELELNPSHIQWNDSNIIGLGN
ncbi:MAG: hypothetical protein AAF620_00285 [Bacteroidota bacterium]